MNGNEERPLPDGWTWTKIGEVAKTTSGGTPSRKRPEYYGGSIPWVKSGELGDSIVTSVGETITEVGLKNSSAKIFPAGTALVALYGATVGKTAILGIDAATNQAVCGIFPEEGLFTAKYMTYWLRSQRDTLIGLSSGGVQPNISQTIVKAFPFPLAPFEEQERIVDEIEKQFTRLDQAVAGLRRLQNNLARYKASVLKAACNGRLVPQDPNDEPAADLLARILAERHAQWEAAHPGKKYQEPVGVEGGTAVLPDLPEGWVWATLDQCFDVSRGRFSVRPRNDPRYYEGSHPFVQIGDLPRDGGNIIQASKTLNDMGLAISKKFPKGTVLIAIVGATIGNTGILTFDSCSPDSLVAFQSSDQLRLQFLEMYLRSKKYEIRSASYASGGQPNINLAFLLTYPIPLPPLAEQERIVAEVERRLSVVTATEQAITTNLARAERLRQSILHRAFTGQL